jgi:hypothetical protein
MLQLVGVAATAGHQAPAGHGRQSAGEPRVARELKVPALQLVGAAEPCGQKAPGGQGYWVADVEPSGQ